MIKTEQKRTPLARVRGALAAAVVIALSSAAASAQTAPAPTPRTLGQEFRAFDAPHESEGAEQSLEYQQPRGVLTLQQALSLALLFSPELAAFSWEIRVQEANALQAGLRPNPEIGIDAEDFAGSGQYQGYDSAQTTVFLGQLVELGGKRGRRRMVAELQRDLSGWDYEVRRLDVLTAVTQAFVAVLEAQGRLELTDELRNIASKSLEAVARQVRAGSVSSVEETRASVNLASAGVAHRLAQAALESARSRLAATWGARWASFDQVTGQLSDVFAPPPIETVQDAVDSNPDIARWATELALRNAIVSLEDARAIPDFTAGAGVRHYSATDDTAMVAGITVPIPVFNRNQGAKHAARYARSKARSEQRAALVRVGSALEIAYQGLRATFDELAALRESVIPQAQAAYEGVQTGYQRGLFRYVDVLESQRTLFELRDRELVALGSYHRAVAEIERLIGEPLQAAGRKTTPTRRQ